MNRIDINNSNLKIIGIDSGGGEIYYYNNQPYTGIIVNYYKDGNIMKETTCYNGYPEGLYRFYHKNGTLAEECYYKNNKLYGLYKEWDENGNLLSEVDCGLEP